jgi:hypothetical protein
MESISTLIDWIEKHPVVGAALLGSIGYTAVGLSRSIIHFIQKKNIYVGSTFWTFGRKFRISAVQKYLPSSDVSGYTQIQHSRPDLWDELIKINSNIFNLRHKIIPINEKDRLAVVISRNGKEKEKLIFFNK